MAPVDKRRVVNYRTTLFNSNLLPSYRPNYPYPLSYALQPVASPPPSYPSAASGWGRPTDTLEPDPDPDSEMDMSSGDEA